MVARVLALSEKERQAKPTNGGAFSPAELIEHMALAEEGNVKFMRKFPPKTLAERRPKVTFVFRHTVQSMHAATKPVATVGYMIPKGSVDVEAAAKKWADLRLEMKTFLDQVESPEKPMVKFLFFFGLASASQYFDLLEAHMHYHETRFPA